MANSEPPRLSQDKERQDIAELLGRILAAYWLRRRDSDTGLPTERTTSPNEKPD
jgi:hypothetical protein